MEPRLIVLLALLGTPFSTLALQSGVPKPASAVVTSKDGTRIAYDKTGAGPVLVLCAGALSDRSNTTRLATLLSERFTVINYDRRGRGESTDTLPYAVEREVEDIEALIDAAGGSACVWKPFDGMSQHRCPQPLMAPRAPSSSSFGWRGGSNGAVPRNGPVDKRLPDRMWTCRSPGPGAPSKR